jgi:hypothetical protein
MKIDLKGVGWRVLGWVDLAQVRDRWRALADTVRNIRIL